MYKALVLGELCVDVILFDPASVPVFNIPLWGKETIIRLGGSASYTAQGLRSLGVDVTINSYVGNDWITRHFLDELIAKDIHLDQVLVQKDITTPICVSKAVSGVKSFIGCSPFSPYPLDLMEVPIQDMELIYFGGYLLYPELWDGCLASLFSRARQTSLIVMDTQLLPLPVDVYKNRALNKECLEHVDILLLNQVESLALTDCETPIDAAKKLSELGPKTVVVKLGRKGCMVWSNDQIISSKPYEITARDPVGAGDFFGAAFAFGVLNNWDLQVVSDFANAFASLCISRSGVDLPDMNSSLSLVNSTRT